MSKPPLSLVKGDWVSSPAWLDLPRTVTARDPHNRNRFCELRVARSDLLKAAEIRRRQPAYDFWSMLAGQVPPVPGADRMVEAGAQDLTRLIDAHACFHGIQRPCAESPNGGDRVAYVLKPATLFAYERRPPVMMLRKEPLPRDIVLLAFARLDVPCEAATNIGVLTHWQLVEADDRDADMPANFGDRFFTRLW